ncbi:hypothetical protein AG1IA_09087 [Rhizoctonia solani AG-1 IA]|uniref:GH16 domain-containing protein n=1 Tax=Thanatephorus cucumeris (strain AG1-IA) TaxID=983506 RepID=L8WJ96_THACA|nr:hypothetical protein AG1IA_09087 [Rhizoctonia solani AG-1 IA]
MLKDVVYIWDISSSSLVAIIVGWEGGSVGMTTAPEKLEQGENQGNVLKKRLISCTVALTRSCHVLRRSTCQSWKTITNGIHFSDAMPSTTGWFALKIRSLVLHSPHPPLDNRNQEHNLLAPIVNLSYYSDYRVLNDARISVNCCNFGAATCCASGDVHHCSESFRGELVSLKSDIYGLVPHGRIASTAGCSPKVSTRLPLGTFSALQQKLAYVDGNGHAIIKVDNTTVGTGDTYGRASIKINSTASFGKGSLVIMDANHLPYGGSPASEWPKYGEIDIIENVNLATVNQMALHTTQGCALASGTEVTGKIISNDCFNGTNGNQGCIVQGATDASYGAGFAGVGGGVYALEWSSEGNGLRIWFFQRGSIPSDMASSSPNPNNWGTPTAAWPESGLLTGDKLGYHALWEFCRSPFHFPGHLLRTTTSTATSTSAGSNGPGTTTNGATSMLALGLGSMIFIAAVAGLIPGNSHDVLDLLVTAQNKWVRHRQRHPSLVGAAHL